jgi:hypothetical protein
MIMGQGGTMKAPVAHKTIKIMPLLCNSKRKVLIVERLPKHASLLNLLRIKGQGICLTYARLDCLRNRSYIQSYNYFSFVQKLQPFSRAKPPFSIIASPTLAIIRSRHTGSIPIQSSRHANLSVHHLCPNSTKLPMRK